MGPKPYILGLICARGGSKGVPRKNLRLLQGKPLIAWAIEVARQCPSLDRVVVSTEDPEIASVAAAWGAEVPFPRPTELAQDDTPEHLVWQHALRALGDSSRGRPDVLASVPATAPLRAIEDVEACIKELLRHPGADVVITVTPAHRNPYFNMVVVEDGWARLAIPPERTFHRRQDAPLVFDVTTVAYAARTDFVLRSRSLLEGRVRAVVVPQERALDIDSEQDLALAEFLLSRAKKLAEDLG